MKRPGDRPRALLVAYCFPPVGGAGVQRPVKWVKYLERAGWDVTVLTPSNPSVPALDESLCADVPAGTKILRARTLEPAYDVKRSVAGSAAGGAAWSAPFRWARSAAVRVAKTVLQPDPQVLWYPAAVREAAHHLERVPHDVVVCTAPPYSAFFIGQAIKRRFGIPLVLDYRDEWDLTGKYLENVPRDVVSRVVQEQQQRALLRASDAVIATTQASLDQLGERIRAVGGSARQVCIYNGYDAEDFAAPHAPAPEVPRTNRFRLVYCGTLWNLTTIEPVVEAALAVHRASPALLENLELVVVGRKTPEQERILARMAVTSCEVKNLAYCEHQTALAWVRSSSALCLLLSDVPGAERVVPAKLFEYLAARKEMLSVLPDGEASRIARRFQPAGCFRPGDVDGIGRWLAERLAGAPSADAPPKSQERTRAAGEDIEEFSRERQTGRLVALLDDLVSPGGQGAKGAPRTSAADIRSAMSSEPRSPKWQSS